MVEWSGQRDARAGNSPGASPHELVLSLVIYSDCTVLPNGQRWRGCCHVIAVGPAN